MTPIRGPRQFLIFGSPQIEEPEIEEVVATLRSGWLGTGPRAHRFENDFREYKEWGYPVAVNSCTAALHLSLLASGLQPGDEVITSALTFCATVNVIIHAGLKPVLADVNPRTMNLDPADVARRIGRRTKAIIPVHFAGRSCEMDALCALAEKQGLVIIEDAAHAVETEYRGRKAGTFGRFGCFSFYVTKNVVTGEGGMILAENEADAQRCRTLSLHGLSRDAWARYSESGFKHYQAVECGFKYNMMDLQAAIGIHQLRRVESNWERRRVLWQRYDDAFADLPLTLPAPAEPDTRHAYHLYTVLVDKDRAGIDRDGLMAALKECNIGSGVHYLSIPEHPYYIQEFGWRPEDYPNAMLIGRQTLSLPLSAKLSDRDAEDVVSAVQRTLLELPA